MFVSKIYKSAMKNIKKIRINWFIRMILYFMIFIISIILIKKQISLLSKKIKQPGMKYILLWTNEKNMPFDSFGEGQSAFIERNCPFTNCIVAGNESLLGSYTNFDAVLFAGPELVRIDASRLPVYRRPSQKYVFASIESPSNYPICNSRFNEYFNWTWTYKLESDVQWGYIVIRDSDHNIVGPRTDMHWIPWHHMEPVSKEFKLQLKSKHIAAAWFVSNCRSSSRREGFVKNLQKELFKYKLRIDIYGLCGTHICLRSQQDTCNKIISKDYYFYLSFENAFSEDYVTEKLLLPLQNNAVPIVYGGANYTRFLPPGSYLNARELGIPKLAEKMLQLINDPERYADMFKWKNHYTYHRTIDSVETNEYCKMCAALNDDKAMKTPTVIKNFRQWWGPACK